MLEIKHRTITVEDALLTLSPADAQDLLCAINIAWKRGYHTDFMRNLMVYLTQWEARSKEYGATVPTWGMEMDRTHG